MTTLGSELQARLNGLGPNYKNREDEKKSEGSIQLPSSVSSNLKRGREYVQSHPAQSIAAAAAAGAAIGSILTMAMRKQK